VRPMLAGLYVPHAAGDLVMRPFKEAEKSWCWLALWYVLAIALYRYIRTH